MREQRRRFPRALPHLGFGHVAAGTRAGARLLAHRFADAAVERRHLAVDALNGGVQAG